MTEPHVCEPDHYPTSLDETWTCPVCGIRYVAWKPDEERHRMGCTDRGI